MSALDPELIDILVCPESHRPLTLADDELLTRAQAAAATGALVNRNGDPVPPPVQALLVRDDGRVAYLVRDDIPIMLIDESIDLGSLEGAGAVDAPNP